jgi:hypothetical protein
VLRSKLRTLGAAGRGLLSYAATGRCSPDDVQSVFRLISRTNGAAADVINLGHRAFARRTRYAATAGILGTLARAQRNEIVQTIRRDAYYVFPNRLPEHIVAEINAALDAAKGRLYPVPGAGPQRAVYNAAAPLAPTYQYHEYPAAMQRLMIDPSVIAIATDYIGVDPILHTAYAWISARSAMPSAAAAQMFHFDVSNLKWLGFFIYLTDVTSESGAHTLVRGSHRVFDGASAPLRARGVVRLSDEEVGSAYAADRIVEIAGKRGTVFCVDTRCCHKGRHPIVADRRVAQLYFVNSSFGVPGEVREISDPTAEYRSAAVRWPRLLRYYPIARATSRQDSSTPQN